MRQFARAPLRRSARRQSLRCDAGVGLFFSTSTGHTEDVASLIKQVTLSSFGPAKSCGIFRSEQRERSEVFCNQASGLHALSLSSKVFHPSYCRSYQ